MDDALVVGGIQRGGDLPDHGDHCVDGHATHSAQAVVEILAFEILHHHVGLAGFGLAEIHDGHQMWVPEV